MKLFQKSGSLAIDAFCISSVVGIYPRFIEPKLLSTSHLEIAVPSLKLDGFKIVHLTDLHFHKNVSAHFLKRILKKVKKLNPDMIVFTGDFICYSKLEDEIRLLEFLSALTAPFGCYCTFGNHDYASYVSRTKSGDYGVLEPINPFRGLLHGFKTLFAKPPLKKEILPSATQTQLHKSLCRVVEKSSFKLLDNETHTLPLGLNIVGLGDYALGRFCPDIAFKGYDLRFPGIILSHNPDTAPHLLKYPGQLILSGHSHGEQIHFPAPAFLRKISANLTRLENPHLSRGLKTLGDKTLYVNRGLGCHKAIRFCSLPEINLITLKGTP